MRANNRPLMVTAIVSTLLLGAVLSLHLWKSVPIGEMTADPVTLGKGLSVYSGFLSQVGILFWSAAASVCLFCGGVLRPSNVDNRFRRFLLLSGVVTLVLALDDVFLLHEIVLPLFGIPQIVVLASYIVMMLADLFIFRRIILLTNYRVLVVSLSFFAISVALDVIEPFEYYLIFFEDGAKLIGLVSWTAYFIAVGENAVGSASGEVSSPDYSDGTA